jgi:hypothetical protein
VPSRSKNRRGGTWITVKVLERELDKARALAQCGADPNRSLHLFVNRAISEAVRDAENRLLITAERAMRMSREQRLAFGQRFRDIVRRAQIYGVCVHGLRN